MPRLPRLPRAPPRWSLTPDEQGPQWKWLHEKYRHKGLRFVVVTESETGACLNPGWNPDQIVCDREGRIQEAMGAVSLPQAFLWSWQNTPLATHADVDTVERAIERWFAETPRILVEQPTDAGDRPFQQWSALRELVRAELTRTSKFDLVATFARLTVESEPSGVAVRLGDQDAGVTPLTVERDPGLVRIEVGDAVYASQWKQVLLQKNQSTTERFTLKARQGGLKVKARDEQGRPLEGKVTVDGQDAGPTGRAFALNVGEHEVVVEMKAGVGKESVTIREGETAEVVVKVVRTVAASSGAGGVAAGGQMRDKGDGTVTDLGSGLVWEKKPSAESLNWSEAKAHCAGKGGGWRLTTISELRSLIRGCPGTVTGGACKVTDSCLTASCWSSDACWSCSKGKGLGGGGTYQDPILANSERTWFWSSSPLAGYSLYAWIVSFDDGNVDNGTVDSDRGVRCVRLGP